MAFSYIGEDQRAGDKYFMRRIAPQKQQLKFLRSFRLSRIIVKLKNIIQGAAFGGPAPSEDSKKLIATDLEHMDGMLDKSKYLTGEKITIVDYFVFNTILTLCEMSGYELTGNVVYYQITFSGVEVKDWIEHPILRRITKWGNRTKLENYWNHYLFKSIIYQI